GGEVRGAVVETDERVVGGAGHLPALGERALGVDAEERVARVAREDDVLARRGGVALHEGLDDGPVDQRDRLGVLVDRADAGPPVRGRRGGGERRAERGEVDRLAPRGELEVVAVLGEDARERLRGGGRAPEALEERDEASGELADDGAVVDERV